MRRKISHSHPQPSLVIMGSDACSLAEITISILFYVSFSSPVAATIIHAVQYDECLLYSFVRKNAPCTCHDGGGALVLACSWPLRSLRSRYPFARRASFTASVSSNPLLLLSEPG